MSPSLQDSDRDHHHPFSILRLAHASPDPSPFFSDFSYTYLFNDLMALDSSSGRGHSTRLCSGASPIQVGSVGSVSDQASISSMVMGEDEGQGGRGECAHIDLATCASQHTFRSSGSWSAQ